MSKRPIVSFHVFHFLKNKLLFLFLIFKQSSHFREKMRIFAFVFCEKNIFRKKVLYLKQLIVQKNLWNSLLCKLSITSFIISKSYNFSFVFFSQSFRIFSPEIFAFVCFSLETLDHNYTSSVYKDHCRTRSKFKDQGF